MKRFLIPFLAILIAFFMGGCGASPEYHHIFPQQYRTWFEQKGIDVDK